MTTAALTDRTADLVDALHRAGLRDVRSDALARGIYATDASLYRIPPLAVAMPRHVDEIAAALSVCRELGVSLTARGAGTSIAGNAVGPGLVLDLSRHLGRVLEIDADRGVATVEPGTIHATLQRAVTPLGWRFGPDPSTHTRCTIAGMIGNNACGSRALGYGRTSDNVAGLRALTGTGAEIVAATGVLGDAPSVTGADRELGLVRDLVGANLATIRTELGRFTRQVSGYALEHLLPERGFDVGRFLVGSEGTLAVVTQATVRLVREPAVRLLTVLGFPDVYACADVAPLMHRPGITAAEGIDRRIIDVLAAHRGQAAVPPLPDGTAWLLVESAADTMEQARAIAERLVADAAPPAHLIVTDPEQAAALWRIREDGAGLASRTASGQQGHAGWEDAAVPPEQLGAYLRDFDALLVAHRLDGVPYGHFGDGCTHIRITFDLDDATGVDRFNEFLGEAAQLVARYGGSLSGEHGDGRARSEFLPLMYSPAVLDVFAGVKAAFDPSNLLNPGVLIDPDPAAAALRRPTARPLADGLGFGFLADGGSFTEAVHRCTGVGKCRADLTGSGGVMCPSYRATGREQDSTRGRARILQELANSRGTVSDWSDDAIHEALELCLSCKGCASDCPTGIDIGMYKSEVLHQTYRGKPRPRSHYSLGRLPRWTRLGSQVPALANFALSTPLLKDAALRAAGVDRRRGLPAFAGQTFRSWFADHETTGTAGKPVVVFVDSFSDAFDPAVGRATVEVLRRAGYAVSITGTDVCCGLTWITTGQLDAAKRILRRSVEILADAARAGIPIVGLEPSCTAVLRHDALQLLGGDDPNARLVAAATLTLAELLQGDDGWSPPDLTGVTVVAQPHCHHHAVMTWRADRALLARAGATVTELGGCCGLAGNFGVEQGHYEVSVAVAEQALLPAVRAAGPDEVILADGFSCRTQLADLAPRTGIHLAQLLAAHS